MHHVRFVVVFSALAITLAACAGGENSQQTNDRMQMAAGIRQSGNLQEAASIYAQLAAESKSSVEPHLQLAAIDRKLGKPQEAITVLRQAQKLQPQDQRVTSQLAFALTAAGQNDAALSIFDDWIKTDANNAAAYNGKAIALDSTGKHEEAQALYRKAMLLKPANPVNVQNNLAMSFILSGQPDEAIAILEPLSKEQGASKTVRQNLALAYGLKGNSKRALALNLQDLPQKEAQENLKFYEQYKRKMQKGATLIPPAHSFRESVAAAAPVESVDSADDIRVLPPKKPAKKIAKAKEENPAEEKKVAEVKKPAPLKKVAVKKPMAVKPAPEPADAAPAASDDAAARRSLLDADDARFPSQKRR